MAEVWTWKERDSEVTERGPKGSKLDFYKTPIRSLFKQNFQWINKIFEEIKGQLIQVVQNICLEFTKKKFKHLESVVYLEYWID